MQLSIRVDTYNQGYPTKTSKQIVKMFCTALPDNTSIPSQLNENVRGVCVFPNRYSTEYPNLVYSYFEKGCPTEKH